MRQPRVGDRILVDITARDAAMHPRDQQNYAGVIVAINAQHLRVRRDRSGEVVLLDATADDLVEAATGEYWLRSTGEPIAQPDWRAEWTAHDQLSGFAHVATPAPGAPPGGN